MKVVINAGHCPGIDPGACGKYSDEADVCRQVGQALCCELEAHNLEPVFVQEDELQDVCDVANAAGCDSIFVSLHCNAFNGVAHGTETFYWEVGDASYRLAERVQAALLDTLGTTDRGLKDGSWLYVLKHTEAAATILVEMAFIDNPDEEILLTEKTNEIAAAIAQAVADFVKKGC